MSSNLAVILIAVVMCSLAIVGWVCLANRLGVLDGSGRHKVSRARRGEHAERTAARNVAELRDDSPLAACTLLDPPAGPDWWYSPEPENTQTGLHAVNTWGMTPAELTAELASRYMT